MPKKQVRDFLSIEQALSHALEQLSENEVLENTKRKKLDFIRYANPKEEIVISLIWIPSILMLP